jgi:tetratricopeptide (TPR) repeat protein
MLGNIYMQKNDLANAEIVIGESLQIANELGYQADIAFNTVKLGQIAQMRGDLEAALARYREGLAIFEKLGMPRESQQVRQMIASLQGEAPPASDPLRQALARARAAAERSDLPAAVQAQQEAVALARQAGGERQALITLSVLLYNLAGYYSQLGRHVEAVQALEEVVALDEQTGHSDLESDRQTLQAARQMAALSPEQRAELEERARAAQAASPAAASDLPAEIQAQLAALPPEQRLQAEAQLRAALETFQRMSPAEQAAAMDAARREQIEQAAGQARDAGLAYARRQAPKVEVLKFIRRLGQQAAEGEAPGSPWLEVAALCQALAALIEGGQALPAPAVYAGHLAAVQSALEEMV